MARLIPAAALSLLMGLAACGDGDDQTANAPATAPQPKASAYQEEILSLDEGQRNAVFIRAIRDANAEANCQGVESSAYVGEHQNAPMWTARCDDGTDWAILLGPTDTAQVITCEAAAEAGLPSCATRPSA